MALQHNPHQREARYLSQKSGDAKEEMREIQKVASLVVCIKMVDLELDLFCECNKQISFVDPWKLLTSGGCLVTHQK